MSRECAYVAGWHARNAETNRAVTRKCAKNEEGRLITGPRLLISGSKVRVLDCPPNESATSNTSGVDHMKLRNPAAIFALASPADGAQAPRDGSIPIKT